MTHVAANSQRTHAPYYRYQELFMEKRSESASFYSATATTGDLSSHVERRRSAPQTGASTSALIPLPTIADQGDNADWVIDDAVAHIQQFKKVYAFLQQRGQLAARETVGRLYVISMRAKEDDEFRARLMQRAAIKVRRDTPYHHAVVRALLRLAGSQVPASTVSDWSKVLRACEYRHVEPAVEAVRQWLTTPERLPNRFTDVSGYEKADAVVQLHEARTRERDRSAKDIEMMKRWLVYAERRRANPLATLPLTGRASSLSKGHTLLLVHVNGTEMTVLDEFETDQSRIQAQVLKKFA
jgi:hypothetical protein